MKSIVAVPILCMSMVVPSVAWSAPFNLKIAGVDRTTSLGQFGIRLTQEMGQALGISNDCPFGSTNCFLASPPLADYNTRIGRSDPHFDGDSTTDIGGAKVSCSGDPKCSSSGFFIVKDDDFSFVPHTPNPFSDGPIGTKEIHTQILSFEMKKNRETKRCNFPSDNAIRAGSKAPDQPHSIGEVEIWATDNSKAESFFNIFVEVDLDLRPITGDPVIITAPDGSQNTLSNGVITLFNKSPLVIQAGELKEGLPPRVVYKHEGSDNAPAVYNKIDGKPFGWVTLAGHGINYDCNNESDYNEFKLIMSKMQEQTELEPIDKPPLSITLDTFIANAANGKVTINWTTGTETDNAGFTLWRATPKDGQCSLNPSNYKDVRQVQPLVYSKAQDGVLGASYSEEDQNVEAGVTYCYGLEDVDYDGKRTFHVDQIISASLN